MASNWYYAIGDNEKGPIPAAELKSLAMDGTIKQSTLVWKEGMDDWKPASEIPGLLPTQEPSARQRATQSSAGRNRSSSRRGSRQQPRDDYGYYGSSDNPYEADYRTRGGRRGRGPEGAGLVLSLGLVAIISWLPMLVGFLVPFLGVCVSIPLGLVSLSCGIGAWVSGNNYMTRCRDFGLEPEGSATAGRICGMIAVILCLLATLLFIGLIALFAISAA